MQSQMVYNSLISFTVNWNENVCSLRLFALSWVLTAIKSVGWFRFNSNWVNFGRPKTRSDWSCCSCSSRHLVTPVDVQSSSQRPPDRQTDGQADKMGRQTRQTDRQRIQWIYWSDKSMGCSQHLSIQTACSPVEWIVWDSQTVNFPHVVVVRSLLPHILHYFPGFLIRLMDMLNWIVLKARMSVKTAI